MGYLILGFSAISHSIERTPENTSFTALTKYRFVDWGDDGFDFTNTFTVQSYGKDPKREEYSKRVLAIMRAMVSK